MKSQRFRESLSLGCLLLFFGLGSTHAQRFYFSKPTSELTTAIGMSIFRGDIGGTTELKNFSEVIDFSTFGFACNAGYRRAISNGFSVRSEINYSHLQGDDAFSESKTRRQRNLHFSSHVFELSAGGEYTILHSFKKTRNKKMYEFYVMAEASVFYFNPKAKIGSTKYALRKYGTEGQGYNGEEKYKPISYALIAGLGYRKFMKNHFSVGVEFTLRRTLTDYLDDVSGDYPNSTEILENNGEIAHELSYRGNGNFPSNEVRGNPSLKDNFGFVVLTLSRPLNTRQQVTTE
jgi:opacity protein-like surface antigen